MDSNVQLRLDMDFNTVLESFCRPFGDNRLPILQPGCFGGTLRNCARQMDAIQQALPFLTTLIAIIQQRPGVGLRIGKRQRGMITDDRLSFINQAEVVPVILDSIRVTLDLQFTDGSKVYRVDVGQAIRGHRYMYRPEQTSATTESLSESGRAVPNNHAALELLAIPGLVAGRADKVHFVVAKGNPLVLWALLGKLFPQNVVLLNSNHAEDTTVAMRSGKQFGAKFILK